MKNKLTKGFATIGLLVVMIIIASGTSAQAQSLEYRLTANIPFDFTVSDKKVSAGEYAIQRARNTSGDLVVQISSEDGHVNVTRMTIPVNTIKTTNKGRLVFHRYGDDYFLVEIWPAGASTGRALLKSRSEREARQKLQNIAGVAAMKAQPETVTILAQLR